MIAPVKTRMTLACVSAAFACLALLPAAAQADTQIESFENLPASTQAGGHPNVVTRFTLSSHQTDPTACACNDARDITAHLPPGLIGNPHATPRCDIAEFSADRCPVDSQVGVAYFAISASAGDGRFENQAFLSPVYNLIPPPTAPGLLGFKSGGAFNTPTFELVSARTDSDYGLDVKTVSIEHIAPLTGFEQLTWGVPADPANDNFRFGFEQKALFLLSFLGSRQAAFCDANGDFSTADPATIVRVCPVDADPSVTSVGEWEFGNIEEEFGPGYPVPSNSPLTPFILNPTTCGASSLTTTLQVLSYDGGTTHASSQWPATTGCDRLTFNPSQAISPTTEEADSPSGAEVRLTVPQFQSPSVPAPSELKAARVTLPEGFSFAPNVTNGKQTCSDAEAKFGTTLEAQCPENAKIGTLAVETPVLPGILHGAVYLGEPKPGNRFRLILAFDGFGVHVKLAGTSVPDPDTGQIHVTFKDLPQAPFADFNMHIFGSERGPLDTPTRCGTYEVSSVFTPWDAALSDQTSRQFFKVTSGPNGSPCPNGPRPFAPGFQAGSSANTAGAHTSFSLNVTRADGNQNLKALKITTPPGFSATLKGIPYCPQAAIDAAALPSASGRLEQANPSCPAASQVGELVAGAGPGTHPLYLPGKVYLAGPYQGAPLSFVFITPAVSGGYDLGNVVVREGLKVDPETARVSTAGGPLPQIFEGIPLRLRQIFVNLNRPNFALNPTNCDPFAVRSQIFGTEGAVSALSSHFQVANCAALGYEPKLGLRLRGSTKRGGNPALRAVLAPRAGDANTASASVALPHSEFLDQTHIRTVCTRVQFNAGAGNGAACPAGSVYGHARAWTPILAEPLEGPVFLRSSDNPLPDLVLALHGLVDFNAVGRIDSKNGGIRNSFDFVPDVPISKLVVDFRGGKKGLLENSTNLCKSKNRATVRFKGQNGKTHSTHPLLKARCGNKKQRKRANLRHSRRVGR